MGLMDGSRQPVTLRRSERVLQIVRGIRRGWIASLMRNDSVVKRLNAVTDMERKQSAKYSEAIDDQRKYGKEFTKQLNQMVRQGEEENKRIESEVRGYSV